MGNDVTIAIHGDNRDLKAKLKGSEREIAGFAGRIASATRGQFAALGASIAGAFSVNAIAGKVAQTLQYFGEVSDMASRLNTTAESIQKLDMIGAPSGASAESLVDALSRVNRALDDPANKTARQAFRELGVDMQKLANATPEEQIMILATAFQTAQDSGRGFNAIYDLLGKSAGNLIPTLRTSRVELERFANTPVLKSEEVAKLDDLGDKLDNINKKLTIYIGGGIVNVWETLANDVLPPAVAQVELMSSLLSGMSWEEGIKKGATAAAQWKMANAEADKMASGPASKPLPIVKPLPDSENTDKGKERSREAASTFAEEMILLQAKASGSARVLQAVERELALRREALSIMKEQGLEEGAALALAKQKQGLEDQVKRRDNREQGIPNKITRGDKVSQIGSLDDYYRERDKPMAAPNTPGLDRLKQLQRGGMRERKIPNGQAFDIKAQSPLAGEAAKAADNLKRNAIAAPELEKLLQELVKNTESLKEID